MKEDIKVNLDNLNYKSLFRIWRYTSSKAGRVSKLYIIIKSLIRLIFLKIKFSETENKQLKIVNSYPRKDYSNFIDKLTYNNNLGKCYLKYTFGFGHKWTYIKEVIKQRKLHKLELNETLLLYFLIKNDNIFLKYIYDEPVVILFAEMQIFENYIAQLAKQVGRYTIGLQHGFYSNDFNRHTVNSLNYKNVAVDEMLVWGKNTKDLLLEHNLDLKVTIVGRPSTHFLSKYDFHSKNDLPSSYVGILDAEEFSETNNKIIEIANELADKAGVKFFIKCHPSTNLKDRNLQSLILEDINCLGKTPHFIGYRSSLLLELVADHFFCIALNESPFLKNNSKPNSNSFYWKKLETEDVSDYLYCTSIDAQTNILNAISKRNISTNQNNPSN